MRQVLNLLEKILRCMVSLFCMITLALSSYSLVDIRRIYKHVQPDGIKKQGNRKTNPVPDTYLSENWIIIDGTSINYQIMQGQDNEEYLNKDINGEFSLAGSIFLDCRSKMDFSDPYSIIYGHHMNGRSMFGELDSYYDEEFFRTHQRGRIIVDGKERELSVFALSREDASDVTVYDPQGKSSGDILDVIHSDFIFYDADTSPTEHLVALSTCTSQPHSNERTMIFGWLKE